MGNKSVAKRDKLLDYLVREADVIDDPIGFFVNKYRVLVPAVVHRSKSDVYLRNYLSDVFLDYWRAVFPPVSCSIREFYSSNSSFVLERARLGGLYCVAGRLLGDRLRAQEGLL